MLQAHEMLFVLLAFVSELLGTLSGVSSSTIFVPLARSLESATLVLFFSTVLHIFGNSYRIVVFRREIHWRLVLSFGVPSLVFTFVGAELTDKVNQSLAQIVLGLFLCSYSIWLLRFAARPAKATRLWLQIVWGALSGLLTGLVGTGGALRSLGLSSLDLGKTAFLATSASIDVLSDVLRAIVYNSKGYFTVDHLFYVPLVALAALLGNVVARKLLVHLSAATFRKIVLILVMASGLLMLFQGATGLGST